MTKIIILYHSGRGHTEAQAIAVQDGARTVDGVTATLITVDDVADHWPDLNMADAIIFGSPTYFGSASGQFKLFMEKTGDVWHAQTWQDKLAAGFTNSGAQNGDKLNTLLQIFLFAMQHGMHWVGLGLLPGNNSSQGSIEDLNGLGAWVGAMAQSNIDADANSAPGQADRKTARYLGRRVALAARHRAQRIALGVCDSSAR